jgi:hypothetical protein
MQKLIFILLIILSVGGCKKNEKSIPEPASQKSEKSIPEQVTGKWEWLKTITPYTGKETNPQSAGFSMTLEFSSNGTAKEFGTVKEYKNGLLISTSYYVIQTDKNGWELRSTIINSHFYFVNDTLIISEAYIDGDAHYYLRLKQ